MPVYSWEKSAKSRVSGGRVHEGKTCFTGARGRSLVEARVSGGRAHWGNRGSTFQPCLMHHGHAFRTGNVEIEQVCKPPEWHQGYQQGHSCVAEACK